MEFPMLCQMIRPALALHACGKPPSASHNHWEEMKQWHQQMINPRTRRVRLSNLARFAHVPPPGYPRLRNALFRLAYSGNGPTPEQIRNGLVFLKTLAGLTHLLDTELHPVIQLAENILEHWHIKYTAEGAFKHLPVKQLNSLWAQVEPKLVSTIARKNTPELMREALLEAARQEDSFLRRKIPRGIEKILPVLQICRDPNASAPAAGGNKDAVAAAVASPAQLIVDQEGRVTSAPGPAQDPAVVDVVVAIDFQHTEAPAEVSRLQGDLLAAV